MPKIFSILIFPHLDVSPLLLQPGQTVHYGLQALVENVEHTVVAGVPLVQQGDGGPVGLQLALQLAHLPLVALLHLQWKIGKLKSSSKLY